MLQALEVMEYDKSVGGRGLEERMSRMFEMFNKDFYFFKRFSFQNLHEIVTRNHYITKSFNNEEIEILSLKSHRKYLCDKLKVPVGMLGIQYIPSLHKVTRLRLCRF
ncbi:hypothetical protein CRG86_007565 [Photobacterium leiognathi]|nr:hypothetical protein CRG86_007565 [Photobacterium leiognathi]